MQIISKMKKLKELDLRNNPISEEITLQMASFIASDSLIYFKLNSQIVTPDALLDI